MRVNINLTLDLDHSDWYEVFGKGHSRRQVAEEVREDVIQYVYAQYAERGIPVTVTRNN